MSIGRLGHAVQLYNLGDAEKEGVFRGFFKNYGTVIEACVMSNCQAPPPTPPVPSCLTPEHTAWPHLRRMCRRSARGTYGNRTYMRPSGTRRASHSTPTMET
jgi:hypothetical protein